MREQQADRIIELLEQLVAQGDGGEAEAPVEEPEQQPKKGRGKAKAAPVPTATLDDARAKLKEFMEAQGMPALKALLAEFEIKKLSDADADADADIYAKIIARADEIAAEEGDGLA